MAEMGYTGYRASTVIDTNVYLASLGKEYGTWSDEQGTTAFQKWDSNELTYTLRINEANDYGFAVGTWTDDYTAAIGRAMADVSAVCNLTFTETAENADMDFFYYYEESSTAGFSEGIGGGDVYLNQHNIYGDNEETDNGMAYGGFNHFTVIHELLHSLGVAHPHDSYAVMPGVDDPYVTGDNALNQGLYTVMSYNYVQQLDANGDRTTGWDFTADSVDQGFPVIGAFDIAMLQALYGVNTTHATGNDIYYLPEVNQEGTYYTCIWDAGGTDEIRSTGSGNTAIDLRAATLAEGDGMMAGGVLSSIDGIYGGFTIAYGAVIENATSGSGSDMLVGNDADNVLRSRGGIDELSGGVGRDKLYGGGGGDLMFGGDNNDTLIGNGGADTLYGDSGWDDIRGGNGADDIYGGQGRDQLSGGGQNDIFWFDDRDGDDTILDFADGVDLLGILDPGASFDDITIDFIEADGNTLVTYGNTTVLVIGAGNGTLTVDDFVFIG